MHFNNNELTIIYNGHQDKSRKTVALARALSTRVNHQDITSARVSVNLFCIMLFRIGVDAKEVINRSDKYYQNQLRNRNLKREEWFYVLKNHPELLVHPIVFFENKGLICKTPTDILKLAS